MNVKTLVPTSLKQYLNKPKESKKQRSRETKKQKIDKIKGKEERKWIGLSMSIEIQSSHMDLKKNEAILGSLMHCKRCNGWPMDGEMN